MWKHAVRCVSVSLSSGLLPLVPGSIASQSLPCLWSWLSSSLPDLWLLVQSFAQWSVQILVHLYFCHLEPGNSLFSLSGFLAILFSHQFLSMSYMPLHLLQSLAKSHSTKCSLTWAWMSGLSLWMNLSLRWDSHTLIGMWPPPSALGLVSPLWILWTCVHNKPGNLWQLLLDPACRLISFLCTNIEQNFAQCPVVHLISVWEFSLNLTPL